MTTYTENSHEAKPHSVKERDIENDLIHILSQKLKYTYRKEISNREELETNFRKKFEALNKVTLTDAEFSRLCEEIVNSNVFVASQTLRQPNTFMREDGTPLQYTLVNIKDWCKNEFEVINQFCINTHSSHHRYDVILLINGLPLVQIELKTLEVAPRRAMEQIVHYKHDRGNGYTNSLLCFMQLFVVSNRANTYYFSNNNAEHFSFNADERYLPIYQFANEDNKRITHLAMFAEQFLAKCTLSEIISRYMVLVVSEKKLMIMRPYQIYAVKAIVDCIEQHRGNGYIWHTTGSGKTLTSFKASTLLKDNPYIDKCVFVVDRKDLDRQTREEFNKFQEGCVEENTNTATLVRRLLSEDYADKVIVTTIQKLGLALDENYRYEKSKQNKKDYLAQLNPIRNKRIVFIFDECHRSQFGENHRAIKEFFSKAVFFGFTGTPIFDENANYTQFDGTDGTNKTTKDIFQKQLHAYTITNAIEDSNVLRFHVEYYKPENSTNVRTGDAMAQQAVVEAILDKHRASTNNCRFNAILASASITHAIEFHRLFKKIKFERQQADKNYTPLQIACIFSPPPLPPSEQNNPKTSIADDLPQEKEDYKESPKEKKDALQAIIDDYNKQYETNHTMYEFDVYYQDIQKRIKDQQYSNNEYPRAKKIDIVIVVDMLLTGFDSKYLNTLYVDKNLKYHGLIQAFSRTNRILNLTKPFGNVLDFRSQEQAVDKAIELFSGKDGNSAKKVWLVDTAPVVIDKLADAVRTLQKFMESQNLSCVPEEVNNLKGDKARYKFVKCVKEIQRIKTQLNQYTDIAIADKAKIEALMPEDQMRSFRAVYLETSEQLKNQQSQTPETIDEVQEDFNYVLFSSVDIDYDYIMNLMSQYTQKHSTKERVTRTQLYELMSSHANLIDDRDDIIEYIDTLEIGKGLSVKEIHSGYKTYKAEKSKREIQAIAKNYDLDSEQFEKFVDSVIQRSIFDIEALNELFAPLALEWKTQNKQEQALVKVLKPVLEKLADGRPISGLPVYE